MDASFANSAAMPRSRRTRVDCADHDHAEKHDRVAN
jgi:hypothetical protein